MTLSDRIARRIDRYPWDTVTEEVDARGWTRLPKLLTKAECLQMRRLYSAADNFRSTVDMGGHGFGRGQYRYLRYPLPALVETLRHRLYARLAPLANQWAARLGRQPAYPSTLTDFIARCGAGGQERPTPLLLRYGPGDFNRLHQDIYGDVQFPLQVLVMLSQQRDDYGGGEVVFVEQKPRMQSRPIVVVPDLGDALVFANNDRPARGARGDHAVRLRHGASELTWGERYVLGIIFHDAA